MTKRGVIVVSAIGLVMALGGCSGPHIKTVTSEQAKHSKRQPLLNVQVKFIKKKLKQRKHGILN